VLILLGCNAEMAGHRAETIATTIAESPLALPNGELSSMSVSLGVAAFPADGTQLRRLARGGRRPHRRKAQSK
jgi:GGDEF domain-containing protein